MNAIIKILVVFAVVSALLTVIGAAFPDQMTGNINGAVVYFLTFLNALSWIFHTDTVYAVFRLVLNTELALIMVVVSKWIAEKFIHA